jgi:hypothetical protein
MQKGGPAPMIRSMKSYEVGGMTDTASGECYEMVHEGPGRPKRRKTKKKRKPKTDLPDWWKMIRMRRPMYKR